VPYSFERVSVQHRLPAGHSLQAAASTPASALPPSWAAASPEPELLELLLPELEPPLPSALASLAPSIGKLASMTLGEPVDASMNPVSVPWDPPLQATATIAAPHTINSTCVRLMQASCRRRLKAGRPDGHLAIQMAPASSLPRATVAASTPAVRRAVHWTSRGPAPYGSDVRRCEADPEGASS
jgi:hypothetical protein